MKGQFQLYNINMKYIHDLANVYDNVMSVSPQTGKKDRPFIGVLVMINGKQYCAPLTSPKPKHKTMSKCFDFLKIMDNSGGEEKIIGVINFNNMIPVHPSLIYRIDLEITPNDPPELRKHKILISKQLSWCRSNAKAIEKNSQKTYNMVVSGKGNSNLLCRCCNFTKLEAVLDKWLHKHSVE